MSLKETLRAIQRTFLREVSPLKMPDHPDRPVFYTKEQEMAMNWEARMQARAIHRLDKHTSVEHQQRQILKEMHQKFYANPDQSLKHIMQAYRTCSAIKDYKEERDFEENYVAQKVANYKRMQVQAVGQGR
ncbi:MAG: hypothetical protein IKV03_05980 [Alphaproteobacteria bacterium]|nr:hypothetical protein [Alphaproteobacteria bacterium]